MNKETLDILIVNASVIDGTGKPAFNGSVGIKDDKIVFVEEGKSDRDAKKTIDAHGHICCPGFIDIHSHADVSITLSPDCYSVLIQGITTFVGGNCGIGNAPMPNKDYKNEYIKYNHLEEIDFSWTTFKQWLETVDQADIAANYVPLVPHNSIRGGVLGHGWKKASTDEQIEKEKELLNEAIDAGAFGMSMSFDAGVPGHYSSDKEVCALFELLSERSSLATAHTRHHQNQWPSDDGSTFYGIYDGHPGEIIAGRYHGLKEFSDYAEKFPKLRCMFSHLTNQYIIPQPHSQQFEDAAVDETLRELIDGPVSRGADLFFNLLPNEWSLASECRITDNLTRSMKNNKHFAKFADEERIVEALKKHHFRAEYKKYFNSGKLKIGMVLPATDPYWSDTYTFLRCTDKSVIGKTLYEVTLERAPGSRVEVLYENCLDVLFDIVISDPDATWALNKDKREYMACERLLCHDRAVPMTDSPVFSSVIPEGRNIMAYGNPPNAYSMFPMFLIRMVREKKFMTIEQAISKITSRPAEIMGIENRGVLKEGAYADVLILDWDNFDIDRDFTEPNRRVSGLEEVIVNGVQAISGTELTDKRGGKVIRKYQQ